jgi:hypothetical protein
MPGSAASPVAADADLPNTMHFAARPVTIPQLYNDEFEPAITMSRSGVLYVSGHVPLVDSARAVALFSKDDGRTWQKLPDVDTLAVPLVGEGVGQGDEGILAADAQGHAWLYDSAYVAGSSFVFEWCDDGARLCAANPLAYDYVDSETGACGPRPMDKPWTMAGHGHVLLFNNADHIASLDSVAQVALLDPATGAIDWNVCAGRGGRPGVPAIRDSDGMVAFPQATPWPIVQELDVSYGTDIHDLRTVRVSDADRDFTACGSFNGAGAFSAAGTYFLVGASHDRTLTVAASADMEHYQSLDLAVNGTVYYMWMTGNPNGEGALVTWAVVPDGECNRDGAGGAAPSHVAFYAAHLRLAGGQLQMGDATFVHRMQDGEACGHFAGNTLGMDGRAYLVVYEGPSDCDGPVPGVVPLAVDPVTVYVQDAGPGA